MKKYPRHLSITWGKLEENLKKMFFFGKVRKILPPPYSSKIKYRKWGHDLEIVFKWPTLYSNSISLIVPYLLSPANLTPLSILTLFVTSSVNLYHHPFSSQSHTLINPHSTCYEFSELISQVLILNLLDTEGGGGMQKCRTLRYSWFFVSRIAMVFFWKKNWEKFSGWPWSRLEMFREVVKPPRARK